MFLQSSGSTSSSTSSGYQSLNSPPKAPGGSAGDYYVVMSSGTSGNRAMSQVRGRWLIQGVRSNRSHSSEGYILAFFSKDE